MLIRTVFYSPCTGQVGGKGAQRRIFGIIVWRIRGYGVESLIWDVQKGDLILTYCCIPHEEFANENTISFGMTCEHVAS